MKHRNSKIFFIVFLVLYFIFLLHHAIHEMSVYMFLGIGVSILAHAKKNIVTLVLLYTHMSIEWFEWGIQTIVVSVVILNIIHTIMDFVFLNHEIKIHTRFNSYLILFFVLTSLVFIFMTSSNILISEDTLEILHRFVLGGVIGCVGSHLVFHLTKEK